MRRRVKQKDKSTTRKRLKVGLIIALVILIIMTVVSQLVVPTLEAKRPLSILLIGSDVNEYRDSVYNGTKPEKTDSLIVATFNPSTYNVEMTSIPRDTSVDYICDTIEYEEDYQDQINEVYQVSGKNTDCLIDTVKNFLNVPIDYYVKVNMDQLAEVVDAVGGIELSVIAPDGSISQQNVDKTNSYYWTAGETVQLDGDAALTYSRFRSDSGKDYVRGQRQQQVIAQIAKKLMADKFNIGAMTKILDLVETNMPVKLMYDYLNYANNFANNIDLLAEADSVKANIYPDEAWIRIFEKSGYVQEYKKTDKQKSVDGFISYLRSENISKDTIQSYFLTTHQFVNDKYAGHFVVVEEQLQAISDALRLNLGLKVEKVKLPSFPYQDNYALGLMPNETAGGSDSSTTTTDDSYEEDTSTPVTETPVDDTTEEQTPTIVDSDNDGVEDSADVCEGFNDATDENGNGTPDGCDEVEVETDTDGDGVTDPNDVCPGVDDAADANANGVADCLEPAEEPDTTPTDETSATV